MIPSTIKTWQMTVPGTLTKTEIPVTVLSRCLQFNLKQMSPTAIVDHLARVLEAVLPRS